VASEAPGFIGPYRLLNAIHTGHTVQIWQAYHDGKHERFVIKTPLERFRRSREAIAELRWEDSVGRKFRHKRIIEIHEFGIDRGTPFLAMEWFAAPNMKQRILQGIEPILHWVPQIIEQAAEGLGYLHRLGWVHRDVKPTNFMVSDQGEVKLIDFALTRKARRGLSKLLPSRTKVQGTRSYIAPEQIRGAAPDVRSDIYSFGCTVYELLAGKPPFTGVSADELLSKHLKAAPPTLEAVNKNITPEFAQLIRRSMAKDPAARPQMLDDFVLELRMNRVFKRTPRPPEEAAVES